MFKLFAKENKQKSSISEQDPEFEARQALEISIWTPSLGISTCRKLLANIQIKKAADTLFSKRFSLRIQSKNASFALSLFSEQIVRKKLFKVLEKF